MIDEPANSLEKVEIVPHDLSTFTSILPKKLNSTETTTHQLNPERFFSLKQQKILMERKKEKLSRPTELGDVLLATD